MSTQLAVDDARKSTNRTMLWPMPMRQTLIKVLWSTPNEIKFYGKNQFLTPLRKKNNLKINEQKLRRLHSVQRKLQGCYKN